MKKEQYNESTEKIDETAKARLVVKKNSLSLKDDENVDSTANHNTMVREAEEGYRRSDYDDDDEGGGGSAGWL